MLPAGYLLNASRIGDRRMILAGYRLLGPGLIGEALALKIRDLDLVGRLIKVERTIAEVR